MAQNQIILYGIGGIDTQYVAIEYQIVENRRGLPIKARRRYLVGIAGLMIACNPTIEHVYAVFNRKGLAQEYRDLIFDRSNPVESRYIFKDTLESEGELIL